MADILLVEDDPLIAHNMARALTLAGHQVGSAHSLAAARTLTASQRYDLLLIDIGLPDGSGLDFARELRHDKYSSPFIFLTAYEDAATVHAAIDCGAHAYLVKPVAAKQLLPMIDSALATLARQAEQANRLVAAIASNRAISAAAGMLAERHQCTPEVAFEAMRRWARQHEVKVESVAQQVIDGEKNVDSLI